MINNNFEKTNKKKPNKNNNRRKQLFNITDHAKKLIPGRVAQSVTCLATDASLTADPGVASSTPAQSHTFVIDHEIISTVIHLPSAESSKKGCCQLQGGGPENFVFNHLRISQKAVWTSLDKQLGPWAPIASHGGSVPVFLRKPIATCDFSKGSGSGALAPLWIHACKTALFTCRSI